MSEIRKLTYANRMVHMHISKRRIKNIIGDVKINPGIDAFCFKCKRKVKKSELKFLTQAPWTSCINCNL